MSKNDGESTFPINEKEVMDYYGYSGSFGRLKIKLKFLRNWILHSLAYSSPLSEFSINMQKSRGVKIGRNCHFNPYVLIDLIYPKMVEIGDNVTLGSHSMIFAHSNPSANLFLKQGEYPRKISKVIIKTGAVINPGVIIIAGVTIGENSIISPRSVVTQDIPDYCVAVGKSCKSSKKNKSLRDEMNILGIDFEEWFHPELIQDHIQKEQKIPKVINGIEKILELLRKKETSATFFVVGEILEMKPELIDDILNNGHEIGFHTMKHTRIDKIGFEDEF